MTTEPLSLKQQNATSTTTKRTPDFFMEQILGTVPQIEVKQTGLMSLFLTKQTVGIALNMAQEMKATPSKVFEAMIKSCYATELTGGKERGKKLTTQGVLTTKGIRLEPSDSKEVKQIRFLLETAKAANISLPPDFLARQVALAISAPKRKGHEDDLSALFVKALWEKCAADYQPTQGIFNSFKEEIKEEKKEGGRQMAMRLLQNEGIDIEEAYQMGRSKTLDEVFGINVIEVKQNIGTHEAINLGRHQTAFAGIENVRQ